MDVVQLNESNAAAYEDYLLNHDYSLFYHSIAYRNFLLELLACESEYLLAVEQNEILGALPLMRKRSEKGDVLNSLPYYGSNGGVISNDTNARNTLIDVYNSVASEDSVASATLICNPLVDVDYQSLVFDHKDFRIGQWTDLDSAKSIDELVRKFESSARRNINKAFRSGIKIYRDSSRMGTLMSMHHENMRNIGGSPKDDRFFELIDSHFEAGRDFEVYIAQLDDVVIGALLLFYYRDIVEYFTPGIAAEFRNLQALPAIIFQAMKDAMDMGCNKWNWGGTWQSQNGVYRFKRKWGAVDLNYDYLVRLNNKEILNCSREEILTSWPGFYVCPFHLLGESVHG